jgi:hypothetical protein
MRPEEVSIKKYLIYLEQKLKRNQIVQRKTNTKKNKSRHDIILKWHSSHEAFCWFSPKFCNTLCANTHTMMKIRIHSWNIVASLFSHIFIALHPSTCQLRRWYQKPYLWMHHHVCSESRNIKWIRLSWFNHRVR